MTEVVLLRPKGCSEESFDVWALQAAKIRAAMPEQLTDVEIEQLKDGVRVVAIDKTTGEQHARHFEFDEIA